VIAQPPAVTARKTVTVFTKDIGRGFCASTIRTDAFADDELLAARRAAARFFGSQLEEITLTRDRAGANVFTARIGVTAPRGRFDLLTAAILIGMLTLGVIGLVIAAKGGW
jgi:hypothetical protein